MRTVELIPSVFGSLYMQNKSRYLDDREVIRVPSDKTVKLIREGAIINLGMRVEKNRKLVRNVRTGDILLSDEEFTLIAMGICKIKLNVPMCSEDIEYNGDMLNFMSYGTNMTGFKATKLSSEQVAMVIKTLALHRIVEKATGVVDKSLYGVYNDGMTEQLFKKSSMRYEREVKYDIEIERANSEEIEQTINRWNNKLAQGLLIVSSTNYAERYVSIGADRVMEATRTAEKLAMGRH